MISVENLTQDPQKQEATQYTDAHEIQPTTPRINKSL
jgi:hypothetical protein